MLAMLLNEVAIFDWLKLNFLSMGNEEGEAFRCELESATPTQPFLPLNLAAYKQ